MLWTMNKSLQIFKMSTGVITWLSLLQLFQVFFSLLKQSRGHLIQGDDTVVLQSQHDSIQILVNVLDILVKLKTRKQFKKVKFHSILGLWFYLFTFKTYFCYKYLQKNTSLANWCYTEITLLGFELIITWPSYLLTTKLLHFCKTFSSQDIHDFENWKWTEMGGNWSATKWKRSRISSDWTWSWSRHKPTFSHSHFMCLRSTDLPEHVNCFSFFKFCTALYVLKPHAL